MSIRPIALCFGLALTPGFAVTAHATYTVIVLADPGGMGNNKVWDINSLGESVGWSQTSSGLDAVLWSTTGSRDGASGRERRRVERGARHQRLGGERWMVCHLDRRPTRCCGLPRERRRCWAMAAQSGTIALASMPTERASDT